MVVPAKEAIRIVRSLEIEFSSGQRKTGSAFIAPALGKIITCAHVVIDDQGQRPNRIIVRSPAGSSYETTLLAVDEKIDLACIENREADAPSRVREKMPEVGETIIFAGLPQGVKCASVFPGIISAIGIGLISSLHCELIQIAGMINNGNSGGPLLDSSGVLLGVISAKYVPLLMEIDKLMKDLKGIPQFPREVVVGAIDFSAFVNLTIKSVWQIAAVLRLVQVGTGWAIPAKYLNRIGGI